MEKIKVLHGVSHTFGPHIVKGRVKIINSPTRVSEVKEGDIIVVPSLDWGLEDFMAPILYEKAGAVIGEAGGGLCHLAIIMRELDKPCLVVENVIKKLIDGKEIRIEINTYRDDSSAQKNWFLKEMEKLFAKLADKIYGRKSRMMLNATIFIYD